MTDISKCEGEGCAVRETCYRHTAPINPLWQSFLIGAPELGDKCPMYWKVENDNSTS